MGGWRARVTAWEFDGPTGARANVCCGSHPFLCTMARTYLRDGRAPIPKDPRTSALMSRIRAKDTRPELTLRALLWADGIRGYRLHHAGIAGRPDIAFIGLRIAIFVHGCFWHGCPHCQPRRPATNRSFWDSKLERNKQRDARKARELRHTGWRVITVWECRLRRAPTSQVRRIRRAVNRAAGAA